MARLSRRVNRQPFSGHSERWHKERMDRVRARRNPVINAMYSTPQWRTLRLMVLRDANYICASYRCPNRATIADHIKPHRGHASEFFDRSNLQALCKRCHDRKTARLDGGFGNPLAKDPRHRSQHLGLRDARHNTAGGAPNEGGESRFLGRLQRARLFPRLDAQPNGTFRARENPAPAVQENSGAASRSAEKSRAPSRPTENTGRRVSSLRAGLTRGQTGPKGPVDTGVGASNHPPAPVRPAIRNKLTRGDA